MNYKYITLYNIKSYINLFLFKQNLLPFEFRSLSLTNLLNVSSSHLKRSLHLSEASFALVSKLLIFFKKKTYLGDLNFILDIFVSI